MFSSIRKRFSYANVGVTLALVFAMTGGAYAAGKYLITSTKQIKPSVLRQLRGKAGAKGTTGPAGPAGPVGPQGPAGANGKDGANGTNGKDGANGVSVTSKEEAKAKIGPCTQGGSEFTSASGATYACNGKAGSPWTAGGTLPEGSSERGQWALTGNNAGPSVNSTSLSFPIPLAAALPETKVHVIGLEEGAGEQNQSAAITHGECTGTFKDPGAESHNLCVFVFVDETSTIPANLHLEDAESGTEGGAGASGSVLYALPGTGFYSIKGSWVVTG